MHACRCHTYPHHPDLNPCPGCVRAIDAAEYDETHADRPADDGWSEGWNVPPGQQHRIGA